MSVFHTKESKSLLAKLMAEEDIQVRHENIQTAYFDVKNRVLAIPMWKDISNDLYDLFVGHEVGHALYTPSDENVLKDAYARSNKSFINVLEDARIEKFMKRKFMGLRTSFIKGYKDLIARNFFEINDVPPENISFIDRINFYFKTASASNLIARDWFTEEEMTWVSRIEKLETFDEVADTAEELFVFMKEKQEKEEQQSGESNESVSEISEEFSDDMNSNNEQSSEDTEDETSDDTQNSGDTQNSDESNESEENNSGTQTTGNGDYKDESQKNTSVSSGSEGAKKGKVNEFSSITDNALERNSQDLVDKNAVHIDYANISNTHNWKNHVQDYKEVVNDLISQLNQVKELYPDFLNDNKNAISYLVKEFEMKKSADAHARSMTANSGQINSGKLWSYQINEDIFKKKTVVPDGKNHGMIMLVDWSGSMHGNVYQTVRQTVTLASFCRRVGIPFEVYGFNDNGGNAFCKMELEDYYSYVMSTLKTGDIVPSRALNLRNYLSSRMNANEFKIACNLFLNAGEQIDRSYWYNSWTKDALSGTPLDDALIVVDKIIYKFRKENSLQKVNLVVLTDGESNSGMDFYKENGQSYDNNNIPYFGSISTYRRKKTVIVDRDTNKVATYDNRKTFTSFMISFLKEKHNINTIGFYLVGGSRGDAKRAVSRYVAKNWSQVSELVRQLRKDNYLVSQSEGYDAYYIVNAIDAKTEELEVNSEMSKSKIVKAFMKHNVSKKSNRQMLNKFVDLVK